MGKYYKLQDRNRTELSYLHLLTPAIALRSIDRERLLILQRFAACLIRCACLQPYRRQKQHPKSYSKQTNSSALVNAL